eukprot:PhM_4_TR5957/c1_g1_i1/m.15780/K15371/GDH2; glutamate dehydrogenase
MRSALSRSRALFTSAAARAATQHTLPTPDQMNDIRTATKAVLTTRNLYSEKVLESEVSRYFGDLGLDASYFRVYTPEDIAHHIQGFIAAKRMASLSGVQGADALYFHIEQPGKLVYFCADVPELRLRAEREIEAEVAGRTKPGQGYSIRTHISAGVAGREARLCLYDITWSDFPKNVKEDPKNFTKTICTEEFARTKPPEIATRYEGIYNALCDVKKLRPVVRIVDKDTTTSGHTLTLVAYSTRFPYMPAMSLLAEQCGIRVDRKYVEVFRGDVSVHAVYTVDPTEEQLTRFNENVSLLGLIPSNLNPLLTDAFLDNKVDCGALLYIHALTTFAYFFTENVSEEFLHLKRTFSNSEVNLSRLQRMSEKLWKEAITTDRIISLAMDNLGLCLRLYEDFRSKAAGEDPSRTIDSALRQEIRAKVRDSTEAVIFESFIAFNEHVVKTNFLKAEKSALSFRIDTAFMAKLGYVEVPFGLFFFVGGTFTGFHIRFRDIARGGVRLVAPRDQQMHKNAFKTLIQENLNLSLTQQRKNKDIPEGGSKGVILVHQVQPNEHTKELAFLQYVDSLCDVMLPNQQGVVDRLGKPELIFLGPDENTAFDYPNMAMNLSRERGYPYYKSFTTGKAPAVGGIPHDTYGMTTMGVAMFKRCVREKWGLKESDIKKVQTAGPSGDLGANEITMSQDKTVAMIDGDAVLYDPNGLDRKELTRLVHSHLTAKHFNPKCIISKDGFVVTADEKPGRNLPDGTVVENFNAFRDTFHFTIKGADFFVPCGGRPRAIDITNVHRMLLEPKELTGNVMMTTTSDHIENLRYRYIVEGANLFITPEARLALENYGVVLFLDASANKGGVTSSSLEVLAALAMSSAEHEQLMCVPRDTGKPSDFYKQYVQGIHDIINRNCRREFHCIEREHARLGGKVTRSVLSNQLSLRMNVLNHRVLNAGMARDHTLRAKVLNRYLPKILLEKVPLDVLMKRVPEAYQHAIFNAFVSSDYVYTVGLGGDETSFSRYMHDNY